MTRITRTLALLLSSVTIAAVAPAAASAANAPNAVLYSGGVPGAVLDSGGVPGAVKPNPKHWAAAPAAKAKVIRPNPVCEGPGCEANRY